MCGNTRNLGCTLPQARRAKVDFVKCSLFACLRHAERGVQRMVLCVTPAYGTDSVTKELGVADAKCGLRRHTERARLCASQG